MPEWKSFWSLSQSTMRPIMNNFKLTTLSFFEPGLTRPSIFFNEIPEIDDRMFGKYRFLVVQYSKKGEQVKHFAVCPNVVIGKRNLELYFIAPNKTWYNLKLGTGRENDYHIPAPFSKRQTISTMLSNNFR